MRTAEIIVEEVRSFTQSFLQKSYKSAYKMSRRGLIFLLQTVTK